MARDPLAAFDDSVIAAAAAEAAIAAPTVRSLARRHQELARRFPGVDDIVYEWRRGLATDPLLERRAETYYLALPDHVWPEFVSALDLSADEGDCLRALHARQVRTALGEGTVPETDDAMVLIRE